MSDSPKRPDKLGPQYRTVTIVRDALAKREAGDERIPIALSSEAPVERYFGTEILDHSTKALDLSRAAGGLPLLVDHDTGDQVGLIEDVALDSDRVLRGMMRFSRSARAQEIKQDVEDGIRTNASIGYQIRELTLEKSDKKTGDTYRATSWTPLEGSIVAVPADPSVGVNRSADVGAAPVKIITPVATAVEARELPMSEQDKAAGTAVPNVEVRDRAPDTRNADLAALAREFAATDLLPKWLEKNTSVDAARGELLARISQNAKAMTTPAVDMSEKEHRTYSLARAIFGAAMRSEGRKYEADGLEREISAEIEKGLPDDYKRQGGVFVPTNIRTYAKRAGLDATASTKGPELKFTEKGEFIDLLRARMLTVAMGARTLSGLVGPVAFPKQTAAGTFTWVGENPGSDVAESNLLLGQVSLSPKQGQSSTSFSRQLLAQTNTDVEALVRDDLAAIHALAIDAAGIAGTGASNQPTGITATAGIGSVAGGTNGLQPTWGNIVDLETQVAVANADVADMGYLTTPGIRGRLKQTTKLANNIAEAIWEKDNSVNGYKAMASTQVPSTLTKGTSAGICHAIIFGDWSSLVYGEWGSLEIVVDPYRLKKQGMIEVTSFQMIGVAVRYAQKFAAMLDALP